MAFGKITPTTPSFTTKKSTTWVNNSISWLVLSSLFLCSGHAASDCCCCFFKWRRKIVLQIVIYEWFWAFGLNKTYSRQRFFHSYRRSRIFWSFYKWSSYMTHKSWMKPRVYRMNPCTQRGCRLSERQISKLKLCPRRMLRLPLKSAC